MRDVSFGKLFGIKLELHPTFIWLFVLMAVFLAIFQPQTVVQSMILLFFLFLSVFLHELSHSIVAIKMGIKVKKIILLPIGGVSLTEELPETPKKEFFMAIAGPLFNFAMVFLILFAVAVFPQLPFPRDFLNSVASSGNFAPEEFESIVLGFPLFGLLWVNFMLGAFNLFVPALPMDGGRVARSILSIKFGFRKATHVIAKVSIFFAALFALTGFLGGDFILILIAGFIFLGSKQENDLVSIKEAFGETTIVEIVDKKPLVLDSSSTVQQAFDLMKQYNKTVFLVALGETDFGSIDLFKISQVKKIDWNWIKLLELCKKIHSIESTAPASKVLQAFFTKGLEIFPVMENGNFLGSIELGKLQNFLELKKIEQKA